VQQVIGGPLHEAVRGPERALAAPGENAAENASLENGLEAEPMCWMKGSFGQHEARWEDGEARSGGRGMLLTVTDYVDGAAQLVQHQDGGECAPTVLPGHRYSLRAWYRADVAAQMNVYLRDARGLWQYWTSSSYLEPAEEYRQAEWTTPELPAGATGLSFGLAPIGAGTILTDDYAVYDADGAPPLEGPTP
jgi:hypothetical protein